LDEVEEPPLELVLDELEAEPDPEVGSLLGALLPVPLVLVCEPALDEPVSVVEEESAVLGEAGSTHGTWVT
jgi:hypothetical protein